MKNRLLLLCLALALLLTGCGLIPESYSSTKPHADSYTKPAEEEIVVNNGSELREALLKLIDEGVEEAIITTDVYDGDDVEKDFDAIVTSIKEEYTKESYLIIGIQRNIVSAGAYYRIDVRIYYRHDKSELPQTGTMNELRKKVLEALENSEETLLLEVVDYDDTDFNLLAKDYSENNMTAVIAKPELIVKKQYPPNQGSDRIVELRFIYPIDHNDLISRKQFVDYMIAFAADSVSGQSSELERARQLYALQIGGHSYTEESAVTPAFALFVDRKGDSRVFSAVYQAMCEKSEVNCHLVHGTKNAEPYDWNILELESGVWHVDVNADAQSGAAELRLRTDAEMEGYVWDTEAYPPCVGLYAPVEPPDAEANPAEDEADQEQTTGQTPQEPETAPEPPEEENPNKPENTP